MTGHLHFVWFFIWFFGTWTFHSCKAWKSWTIKGKFDHIITLKFYINIIWTSFSIIVLAKKNCFCFFKGFFLGGGIWQFFFPQKFNMQQFSFYYIFFIIKIWAGEHTVKFSFLSILHIFEREETACIYILLHVRYIYIPVCNMKLYSICC